jgi:hypothetical protein
MQCPKAIEIWTNDRGSDPLPARTTSSRRIHTLAARRARAPRRANRVARTETTWGGARCRGPTLDRCVRKAHGFRVRVAARCTAVVRCSRCVPNRRWSAAPRSKNIHVIRVARVPGVFPTRRIEPHATSRCLTENRATSLGAPAFERLLIRRSQVRILPGALRKRRQIRSSGRGARVAGRPLARRGRPAAPLGSVVKVWRRRLDMTAALSVGYDNVVRAAAAVAAATAGRRGEQWSPRV